MAHAETTAMESCEMLFVQWNDTFSTNKSHENIRKSRQVAEYRQRSGEIYTLGLWNSFQPSSKKNILQIGNFSPAENNFA